MPTVLERLTEAVNSVKLEIKINELPPTDTTILSLDIEHDERGNFVCCGFYSDFSHCAYIIFDLDLLRNVNFHAFHVIAHNGISDLTALQHWGLDVPDLPTYDTMLIGHILDSSLKTYGLKDMTKRELGVEYPSYDEIVGKHKGKTKKALACPKFSIFSKTADKGSSKSE